MRVLVFVATSGAALGLAACGPTTKSDGCVDTLIAGDLVVTEVFANYKAPPGGAGTDEGKEWFEVYNAGDRPLELEGMTIVHSRPDGSKEQVHVMEKITIAPNQYMTLGNSVADLLPAYIDYGYSADLGDFYNSDGGKLALKCGDTEIDNAVYDGIVEGRSRQLTSAQPPDYTLNDDQLNWCEGSAAEFDANNFGTPGSDNDCTPVIVGQCSDNGTMRDVVAPAAGDLVITEIMPNPAGTGDEAREWFEVRVMNDVDLNGLGIDRLNTSTTPDVVESADCLRVTAGSHVIFARSTDPATNGALPADAIVGTFAKTGLVQGSAASPGDLQLLSNGTVVDAVTWTGSRDGKSISLDPDSVDPASNDNPSNFCDATTMYSATDAGTPGALNDQCMTGPGGGMCDDNGTMRPVRKPSVGALVISEIMANPAGTDTALEWFEVTNAGGAPFDLNGLKVTTTTSNTVTSGKCLTVAPGGFALFARNGDPATNMLPTPPDVTVTVNLGNSSGTLSFLDGTEVIDAMTWTSSTDGASWALDPDKLTATDNDAPAPTAGTWCPGTAAYAGTNKGTPRAANSQCP